jgi:hypothetical protein
MDINKHVNGCWLVWTNHNPERPSLGTKALHDNLAWTARSELPHLTREAVTASAPRRQSGMAAPGQRRPPDPRHRRARIARNSHSPGPTKDACWLGLDPTSGKRPRLPLAQRERVPAQPRDRLALGEAGAAAERGRPLRCGYRERAKEQQFRPRIRFREHDRDPATAPWTPCDVGTGPARASRRDAVALLPTRARFHPELLSRDPDCSVTPT